MSKVLPTDPNMITPAIRATLPAFQLVQDRERTPEPTELEAESQHSAHELEAEPEFILAPRTYTPVPSPQPPQAPIQPAAPAPEIRQRSSLRKRFSLKRKETPQEIALQPPPSLTENKWGPRHGINSSAPRPDSIPLNFPTPPRERSVNTPPSRGLDSAYCSDFEKPFSPPSQLTQTISNSPRMPPARLDSPPVLSGDFMPSPRSDQQFFRPVNASPNSPLQRPWTAAPGPNHIHSHSAGSNGSQNLRHAHTPSALGNRRGAPSAMGMSMMSDMTMVTENGKKVKKKRSAFGWLKKAFALSEEEKMAFEERRRRTDWEEQQKYYERPRQRWVDGKRVR